jgi:hypothetical protein
VTSAVDKSVEYGKCGMVRVCMGNGGLVRVGMVRVCMWDRGVVRVGMGCVCMRDSRVGLISIEHSCP